MHWKAPDFNCCYPLNLKKNNILISIRVIIKGKDLFTFEEVILFTMDKKINDNSF